MKKILVVLAVTITTLLVFLSENAYAQSSDDANKKIALGAIAIVVIILIVVLLMRKGDAADNDDEPEDFTILRLNTFSEARNAENDFQRLIDLAKENGIELTEDVDIFIPMELEYRRVIECIEDDDESSTPWPERYEDVLAIRESLKDYTEKIRKQINEPEFIANGGYTKFKKFLAFPGTTYNQLNQRYAEEQNPALKRKLKDSRDAFYKYQHQEVTSSDSFIQDFLILYYLGFFDDGVSNSLNVPEGDWDNNPQHIPSIHSNDETYQEEYEEKNIESEDTNESNEEKEEEREDERTNEDPDNEPDGDITDNEDSGGDDGGGDGGSD